MKNGIFSTSWKAVGEAVLTAAVTAIIVALYGDVIATGFNIFSANWSIIGSQMVNLGFIAGITVLGKDFLSTNQDSLLNIGPAEPQ